MPPMDVKTVDARGEADSAVVRVRRDHPVAALDDGPAAGRRASSGRSSSSAGDRVRAGQPLVQIDPDRQQATVTVTESQRAAREADLALREAAARRACRSCSTAGAVSRAELEQAETAHKTAEAQLDAVQSQIRENQVQLQYYRVTAPGAGIVGDIPVRQGDRVTPSTVITTIDQARGPRGVHQRAARAGDAICGRA